MLTINKHQILIHFPADVFMCRLCKTGSGLSYWNLRLLTQGKLIDAFHWNNKSSPILKYKEKDSILIHGRWTNNRKERIQVLKSEIISSFAANDETYLQNHSIQLELNFGSDLKTYKRVKNTG